MITKEFKGGLCHMNKYVMETDKLQYLNYLLGDKNEISILNAYDTNGQTEMEHNSLCDMGIITPEGNIPENIKQTLDVLVNPHALVKIVFSGGVEKYEHSVSYDKSFHNPVSFTATPKGITVANESDNKAIIKVIEEFVGKSSLKSVNFQGKFSIAEALVICAMLDMEKKASLIAFVDELPYTSSAFNSNIIWRMINSTNPSIQWFVYNVNEVIGENVTLTQSQVQEAMKQLSDKGIITNQGSQYQLSPELSMLSSRMVIIDNVLTVETIGKNQDNELTSAGFLCVQSGIHDLLFMDYDGSEIIFKSISSAMLLEYIEHFLQVEAFCSQLS